jgi:hypothetical protein
MAITPRRSRSSSIRRKSATGSSWSFSFRSTIRRPATARATTSGQAIARRSSIRATSRGAWPSTLSVTAGTETITPNPYTTESITATGRTKDTFAFTAGFGNDTITGFAATGANHDVIQLGVSMSSYLTSEMSQAQDLAVVLSHATSSGGTTTITDSLGDALKLNSVSVATLTANPADFKFA